MNEMRPALLMRSVFLLLLGLLSATLFAQQVNFATVVDQTTISKHQVVQVEYVVENAKKIENFEPPSFRNFAVLQGPIQSSGMTYVNGNLTEYKALVFVLQPRKTGKLIIPGATAVIDGKRRQSDAVAIEVTNSPTGGTSAGRPPLRFNIPEERVEADREFVLYPNESVAEKIKKNLFVRVEVNKKECFVNEPVIATYKLYSRLRSESRVVKRPSYNGFSVYDMQDPEAGSPTVETFNGRQYNVHVIRKSQLFPLQAGDFTLDPVEVENTVRFIKADSEQDNYLEEIGDPYAETVSHTLTVASSVVPIHVKPLPAVNQPGSFDGAVGKFLMVASLKTPIVKAGETANLLVQIKGNGNLPMINAPAINWPSSVEAFEPTAKEEIHPEIAPLSGVKTFEYVFSPKDTGEVTIPPVRFAYFDPVAKSYRTDSTKAFALRIVPGEKVKHNETRSPAVGPIPSTQNMWLWIGAGTLITLLIITLVVANSRKRNKAAGIVPVKRAATVQAPVIEKRDKLEKAKQLAGVGTAGTFVKEVETAIWNEVGEKFGIPPIHLNQREVVTALQQRGADEETIQMFRDVMKDCETILYIPSQGTEDRYDVIEKAERFLDKLDSLK
jgi:hypothetical protein